MGINLDIYGYAEDRSSKKTKYSWPEIRSALCWEEMRAGSLAQE
jgi:hypothetical protein